MASGIKSDLLRLHISLLTFPTSCFSTTHFIICALSEVTILYSLFPKYFIPYHLLNPLGQLKLSTQYINHTPLLCFLIHTCPLRHTSFSRKPSLCLPDWVKCPSCIPRSSLPAHLCRVLTSGIEEVCVLVYPLDYKFLKDRKPTFIDVFFVFCLVCKRDTQQIDNLLNQLTDSLWPDSRDWKEGLLFCCVLHFFGKAL